LNRVATETPTLVGGTPIVLTHGYDPRYGNRETLTDSLGGSTLFGFDNVNRVNSVTSASGPQIDLAWDGDGRLAGVQYPNGISSTYAYDPSRGLLDTLTFADGASTLFEAAYTFDAAGRISTIVEGGQTRTFAYDSLGRVTGAGTSGLPESYAYDAIGNRTFSHLSASYAHDDADRLLSEASHTYTYDKNGNLRTKTETATGDLTTYTYDGLNRLISVALPGGGTATYRYDALGAASKRTSTAPSPATATTARTSCSSKTVPVPSPPATPMVPWSTNPWP
jgi:YD repeat-containing protein